MVLEKGLEAGLQFAITRGRGLRGSVCRANLSPAASKTPSKSSLCVRVRVCEQWMVDDKVYVCMCEWRLQRHQYTFKGIYVCIYIDIDIYIYKDIRVYSGTMEDRGWGRGRDCAISSCVDDSRPFPPTNAYSAGNFAKEIRGFRWHSGRRSPRVGSLDGVKDLSLGEISKDRRDNASSIWNITRNILRNILSIILNLWIFFWNFSRIRLIENFFSRISIFQDCKI